MQRAAALTAALLGALLVSLLGQLASGARAQDYPDRPTRIIMPAVPGGVLDVLTRALGEQVRLTLGQPWIVENRPGASGSVGLQACTQAAPDGNTLCATTGEAMSVTPHYEPKLYERYRTLVAVTQFVTAPGVVYAHAALDAKDLKQFVALARAKPGQLNYSSWGLGTSGHVLFEWLKRANGIDIVHVPHRGSNEAVAEVVAGRIDASYMAMGYLMPHVRSGAVRPLASLGDERSGLLPDTPSFGELGIAFPYKGGWFGLLAPEGTPLAMRARVAAAVRTALDDPGLKARFLDPQGYKAVGSSPEDFAAKLRAEYTHGAEVIRFTGIKSVD